MSHPAFVLLDPSEQERRASPPGDVSCHRLPPGRIATSGLGADPAGLGTGLPNGGPRTAPRGRVLGGHHAELDPPGGPAGERHATTLSLSLDMRTSARQIRTAGGGIRGAAAVLRQEMNTLVAALRSADLSLLGVADARQIAVMLRSVSTTPASPPLRNGMDNSDSRWPPRGRSP
ncbi:MAG: hypothetical protein KIT69_01565 [Propionibacteriaceae bacterium]|nr:hypothetical protein [Propionibacteriaceae bacterium]